MVSEVQVISEALRSAVRRLTEGKDMAVAFSGGLDSGIVAALTMEYARSVSLYTVGYGESYDVRMAREMASDLRTETNIIPLTEDNMVGILDEMISVTGTSSPLTLAFETPPFMVCRYSIENILIGGQGADELFAGYSKYLGLGKEELQKMRAGDIAKLTGPTLDHERKVADHFGKTVLYPFLDEEVVNAVNSLSIDAIMPRDGRRKGILKDVAEELGYPFIADKEKKAAQYGSGMMDVIRSICKKRNIRYSELVEELCMKRGIQ